MANQIESKSNRIEKLIIRLIDASKKYLLD